MKRQVTQVLNQPMPSSTETEATSLDEELENFLKENQNLTHEERIDLCLLQLHKEKVARGQLTNSQAFITRKLVSSMDTGGKIDTPTDLKSVVNRYCFILTDGKQRQFSEKITDEDLKCSDPIIALDILIQMDRRLLSIEEVLEHPVHWNNFFKIHFICKAHDYICDVHNVQRRRDKNIHEKYGMGDLVGIVSENGWIEQLRLRQNEMMRIQKQCRFPVAEDLIYNIASKTQSTKTEREKSVFELVRFIRIVVIHIYAHSQDVHIAFGGFPDGFWNFFSSRFPKLFMHVYSHMKTYLCTSDVGREFLQQTSVPEFIYKSLSKNIGAKKKKSLELFDSSADTKRQREDSDSPDYKIPEFEMQVKLDVAECSAEYEWKKDVFNLPSTHNVEEALQTKTTDVRHEFALADPRKDVVKSAREAIDEAFEKMTITNIFALKNQILEEESVKYLCSKLHSGFDLLKLKLEDCGLDKPSVFMALVANIPTGKVKILNLSKNKQLDFSKIEELLPKLQCDSLHVSTTEFNEGQTKILGHLQVRRLMLDYATLPKSISSTLTKLLKNGMEELSLVDANISCEQLKEIAQNLNGTKFITLIAIDLSHIKLDEEGLEAISTIINKAKENFEKLCLFNSGLNAKLLKWFSARVVIKVIDLDIGCNENIAEDGMQAVINVADKLKIQKLDISSLSLEAKHIRQLNKSLLKITDLNLSDNPEIEAADVGKLLLIWKTTRLNISECQFLQEDFEELVTNLGSHKLETLRCNELSKNTHWKEITSTLKKVAKEIVTLEIVTHDKNSLGQCN